MMSSHDLTRARKRSPSGDQRLACYPTEQVGRSQRLTSHDPTSAKEASLPPRWFITAAWAVHRAIYSLTRGRLGLRPSTAKTWGEPEPAWWLNLQANPDTTVELNTGERAVHGRAATPDERPQLWAKWGEYDGEENLKSWASRRPGETAVVILEPRGRDA
jgi:hypothetical protein